MNKKAGIRFNPEYYVDVNMDDMMVKVETPEGVTEYPLNGGEWTETKIFENPNPNVAQPEISFQYPESLKGYTYFKIVWKETIDDEYAYMSINEVIDLGEYEGCLACAISLDNIRRVSISSDGQELNSLLINNSITNTGDTNNTTNIILAIYGIRRAV